MARGGSRGAVDRDRAAVYGVEDAWSHVLDRGGVVVFYESNLQLPCQRVMGSLAVMQQLVDHWLADVLLRERYPQATPVTVRARRGSTQAHYESSGVIAIPLDRSWACRETVIAHEVAHHLSHEADEPAHGPGFRRAMVCMAEVAFGPEAAVLLRAGFDGAGLAIPDVA